MKIVMISDTHSQHRNINIPDGDIIIHAGDFTNIGRKKELQDFIGWFDGLSHPYKILIPGNHDKCFDNKFNQRNVFDRYPTEYNQEIWTKEIILEYTKHKNHYFLINSGCEIEGVKFWGSPATPWFHGDFWAFNYKRGLPISSIWKQIPNNTDVIITHGPPMYILDYTNIDGLSVGCKDLYERIMNIKPKIHVFGHIHEGYGIKYHKDITFINASILDENYNVINKPIIITL